MNNLGFVHQYAPAPAADARVLLLLHGTGGDENDLLSLGRQLDPAAALLSPRGNVSENGQARFFRRFAEGVFDEEDIVRRALELAEFIQAAAEFYAFDPAHVTAVGYSNGANIAAAILLLRPETLTGGVLWRAMVTLTQPPPADLKGKRVLISAGRADPIIPRENAERLAATLRERGAKVQLEVQEAGHGLIEADITSAQQWLAA